MRFTRVNGVVLHYDITGDESLPPLVFSNSLGTDFRIWDDVASRLKDRYRIVRYDKRGHGLSEATRAPYALLDHVEDVAALLDFLKVKHAAIAGLSVGGMIAQGLAATRPDLVSALILADTAHRIGTVAAWNERIETVTAEGISRLRTVC